MGGKGLIWLGCVVGVKGLLGVWPGVAGLLLECNC
jgi:hypothetical protein